MSDAQKKFAASMTLMVHLDYSIIFMANRFFTTSWSALLEMLAENSIDVGQEHDTVQKIYSDALFHEGKSGRYGIRCYVLCSFVVIPVSFQYFR